MTERVIDTVEAYQALEAVVEKFGADYRYPSNFFDWFTLDDTGYLSGTTQFGCILGQWMNEVGVPIEDADNGNLPHSWDRGIVNGKPDLRATRAVAAMFADTYAWNDKGMPWGEILLRVKARAFGGDLDAATPVAAVAEAIEAVVPA